MSSGNEVSREAKKPTPRRQFIKQLNKRSAQELNEIKELESRIASGGPTSSHANASLTPASPFSYADAKTFDELPISEYSKEGLSASKYTTLTAIQRAAIPHALAGRDILGAAKTGSGKTLSFIIPLIEKLYRLRWGRKDGLGALVLTPTRELAMQIFEELRKVGKLHELSAGLLIGGKNVKEEQQTVGSMNILIATPGRLLQHMDETPGFDATGLKMLVLDEADRILDMGFSATLDAILDNLPSNERQTLLFSATQTKSVKDLARLSLIDPEYISVHKEAEAATPVKLDQAFAVIGLEDKMNVVWGFAKSHLKAKTIIFLSTCKQVRFVFETFRRLRPGVPVRALHGGLKQMKRMAAFYEFCEAKEMLLFATDIAARGLDFPTVDWVLQMDCPEDVAAYIHRVGRTARYTSSGRALLLLTPSEHEGGFISDLQSAKVPIKQTKINPKRAQPIGPALQALLSKNVELKEFGQRAIIAYVRSVFLQPNKKVFDVTKMAVSEFAQSMGLMSAPKLRFLKKVRSKASKSSDNYIEVGGSGFNVGGKEDGDAMELEAVKRKTDGTKVGRLGVRIESNEAQDDEDDAFMTIKKRDVFSLPDVDIVERQALSADHVHLGNNVSRKKLKIKAGKSTGVRQVFDDEGQMVDPLQLLASEGLGASSIADPASTTGVYVVKDKPEERFREAAEILRYRDKDDKARIKEKKNQEKMERKRRRKEYNEHDD